jgi:hypothetical protein
MKIVFNDVGEFIEELTVDPPPDKILRTTTRFSKRGGEPYHLVSVMATFVNKRGQVAELSHLCGEDWGEEFESTKQAHEHAKQVFSSIRSAAKDLGLEVRSGVLEE